jgi:hypothetical protein
MPTGLPNDGGNAKASIQDERGRWTTALVFFVSVSR